MEQNFQSNTMNLGNLGNTAASAIPSTPAQPYSAPVPPVYSAPAQPYSAPVYTNTDTVAQPSIQPVAPVQEPVQQPVQEPVAPVQPITPVQEEVKEQPTAEAHKVVVEQKEIINNEKGYYRVNTANIQTMLKNIANGVKQNNNNFLCAITQLKFTASGLQIIASDNDIIMIQEDPNVKSVDEMCIGVKATLFKNLVDKITDEEFTLNYVLESRLIKVITAAGEFLLSEEYEASTGETINIPVPEEMLNLPTIEIPNMPEFQQLLKQMQGFSGKNDATKNVAGVYFGEGTVSANDKNNFCLTYKPTPLSGQTLFLKNGFIDAIKDMDFGVSAEIGLIVDEGRSYPSRVIVKKNNTIVIGYTMDDSEYMAYPLSAIKGFADTDFAQQVSVNKSSLLAALERTQLFINQNTDRDVLHLSIQNQGFNDTRILIQSKLGTAKESVKVNAGQNNLQPKNVYAKILMDSLKIVLADEVKVAGSDDVDHIIGILTEDATIILSLDQG